MGRAGAYIKQQSDYSAFIPASLPPVPKVLIDEEMYKLLSDADRKLGRLDGITQILPNPELFVAMYVKKEALLSSQIEGTQASLIDILGEDDEYGVEIEVSEVVNYVHAMKYGLSRLNDIPMSLRLIREIHAELLRDGRGSGKNPGEFRITQNWIGPPGCSLSQATFIPPPAHEMLQVMGNLETFMHETDNIPTLIKIGLIHAQFETIHPFLDGNGRMGRLLITFWLCQQKILSQPLLYLSYYFKQNRIEYYDRLMETRIKGDWEGWIRYFLRGISNVSDEAIISAKEIINLQRKHSDILRDQGKTTIYNFRLLDVLYEHPIVSINFVKDNLEISYPTAKSLVDDFCTLGFLRLKDDDAKRNRKFIYTEYIDILNRGTETAVL